MPPDADARPEAEPSSSETGPSDERPLSDVPPPDTSIDADTAAETPDEPGEQGTEHGDRNWFLASARERLAGGVPTPAPASSPLPSPEPDVVTGEHGGTEATPPPAYPDLDPDDLVGTFVRAVEDAGGVCHLAEGEVPDTLLDHLVAELNAWEMVVSAEPEAAALGERLARRGVEVRPATYEAAVHATVGVTSAVAGIAATGSVVLDSRRAGGRLAPLLPAVHLCVLPVERLLATPADLFRRLGAHPEALPPTLVIETGPSRTGDIEHLLARGATGPIALHVVLVA